MKLVKVVVNLLILLDLLVKNRGTRMMILTVSVFSAQSVCLSLSLSFTC